MIKKSFTAIVLLLTLFGWAQEKYQYVIVPAKFEFLKEANQYGLNTLTKSFFETEGFTVFYDTDELPIDIANNRCKVLYAEAVEQNKLFTTNVLFEIKDCQGKVLYESFRGSSREKSYEVAYKEAFRATLSSMKGQLNLTNNFIINVAAENKPLVVEAKPDKKEVQKQVDPNQLFALPIENGYRLVDSVPNVIYTIQQTSVENVFIAQKGEINGVFQKKINGWYFDYYQNGNLVSERISVKF
ncbi:hypothetical protein NHF50_04500 [Flavobacterium sp. NRK F10]|uniref:hypothetical protein n=1 Tax=Flavobacterium sp. NRK F10 TaxID=2954931 RepID=UPI002091D598|nr:hypothetical protein [Flavobacterium sp. NRK F10]MCO6174298.1 hypothetical protein [Flavobacterium sp. NRK F10]